MLVHQLCYRLHQQAGQSKNEQSKCEAMRGPKLVDYLTRDNSMNGRCSLACPLICLPGTFFVYFVGGMSMSDKAQSRYDRFCPPKPLTFEIPMKTGSLHHVVPSASSNRWRCSPGVAGRRQSEIPGVRESEFEQSPGYLEIPTHAMPLCVSGQVFDGGNDGILRHLVKKERNRERGWMKRVGLILA